MDPNAGSWNIDAVWNSTAFQLDYLTKPSGLLDIGIDINKFDPATRVKPSDKLLIAAYPHYDPRYANKLNKYMNNLGINYRPLCCFSLSVFEIIGR